ncbi:phosphotyrosine protein phosphatase [Geobacillus sp. GHH01]|uniref:tyrosine-protein phosphatase n=1 Tax=Geobacillus sp. GHH01 TaxID=1233873 RepID=UPI0002AF209A|nr:CpsB/CapC family capsule biosynthesis tyrosine phosphatase [Geobacillus sp. GHH01]AGE23904.1 phosphotyrosine protein phosphatase [Geobacillus sp. GHH01]
MIDIHSHILPGVDDGAKTMDDAIAMAKAAVDEGITTIIATPHHHNGKYDNPSSSVTTAVRQLNAQLEQNHIPLKVLAGQEVRLHGDLLDNWEKGDLLPLGEETPYILVEFPFDHVPRYANQLLFEMQLKGLTPVIAHPERNSEIIEKPDRLYELVQKGVLTQVTAASVAGFFGKNIQKFSMQLIEANWVHFIASDAHNLTSRSFQMRTAYDTIDCEFGIDAVYFFQENAEQLVNGQTVYRDEPVRIKKKKFLGLF